MQFRVQLVAWPRLQLRLCRDNDVLMTGSMLVATVAMYII
jgi:hypothetical protein